MSEEDASSCPYQNPDEDLSDLIPYGEGITYNDYLKIKELIQLQEPLSDPEHHDEMLFIVIHQAYELWFKVIIQELEHAMTEMENRELRQVNYHLERCCSIMELLVKQIHLLETMRPSDFIEFRDNLKPASGFQSLQFREIEFLLGLKNEQYLKFFENEPGEKQKLKQRMEGPDVRETYYRLLDHLDFDVPSDVTSSNLSENEDTEDRILDVLKEIYEEPDQNWQVYDISESLVTIDEQLGLWRDHHVRVVERIIGRKTGTGGSSGVGYLESTTGKRCFPYLWQVRTHIENS